MNESKISITLLAMKLLLYFFMINHLLLISVVESVPGNIGMSARSIHRFPINFLPKFL